MKNIFVFITLIIISFISFAQDLDADKEAIKKVIQTAYVEGLQNEGDLEKIDSGIHPDFVLIGIDKGNEMWQLSIDEWKEKTIKRKEEGKFPRVGDEMVKIEFQSIDITGTAAVVKIDFYVGAERKFVDYIGLYKFEDGWKMVNKIFYRF